MKGIGIDTGGTCTDAVIYDFDSGTVLASAKTLTTHQDLKIGITEVLHLLPEEHVRQCKEAALSTTLATNACVENRGGHGKIIFFGVSRKVFMNTYRDYGFSDPSDVLLIDCRILSDPAASEEPVTADQGVSGGGTERARSDAMTPFKRVALMERILESL